MPVKWVAFFGVLVLMMFGIRGMYSDRLRSHLLDEIRSIVSTTAVATMAVISLRVVLENDPLHRRADRADLASSPRLPFRRAAPGSSSAAPAPSPAARAAARR